MLTRYGVMYRYRFATVNMNVYHVPNIADYTYLYSLINSYTDILSVGNVERVTEVGR